MFPVSWPVSVVLAAILSIIHFSFRIVLSSGNFPELFIQTVSEYGNHTITTHTHSFILFECVDCVVHFRNSNDRYVHRAFLSHSVSSSLRYYFWEQQVYLVYTIVLCRMQRTIAPLMVHERGSNNVLNLNVNVNNKSNSYSALYLHILQLRFVNMQNAFLFTCNRYFFPLL